MVSVIDRAGILRYVNPAGVRFVGHDRPEDLLGGGAIDLVHPDDRPRAASFFAAAGAASAREFRFHHKHGRSVVGEITGLAVEYDGDPALLVIVNDVTARREMQAQMMLTARMASVGTLAAGVAHEINNPLAYIGANLEYAVRELRGAGAASPAADRQEVVEALEEARQGAERVRVIVRDLKTFSRAEDEERHRHVELTHVI